MAENYIETSNILPSMKFRHFVYLDSLDCHGAGIFQQYKLHVKPKETWSRDGENYQFVVCDVPKQEVDRFMEALEALKESMLIFGHRDYEEACVRLFTEIIEDAPAEPAGTEAAN